MPTEPHVPPPPEDPDELLVWAAAHQVAPRLDDLLVAGDGPPGRVLPARSGDQALTYRQILLDREGRGAVRRRHHDLEETARFYLHRIASAAAAQRAARSWLDEHGREPDDEALLAFVEWLREAHRRVVEGRTTAPRPPGTYEPGVVRVERAPLPVLRYEEWSLVGHRAAGASPEHASLLLLGWSEGPPRWQPEGVPLECARLESALEAMIDFVRDPRAAAEHEQLIELLRQPAWQYALGTLDENLSRLAAAAPGSQGGAAAERVAFRVVPRDGSLHVEPVAQKRGARGGFSKGSRLEWYQLPQRRELSAADRRVFLAHDDRFARESGGAWGGGSTRAQTFGVLRALIDHPAVFLEGEREGTRLDIRQGRMRLRFAVASDGGLVPQFELLGLTLLAPEVARVLGGGRHVIHLHRQEDAAPQVLLAEISAQAAATVQALAVAPARFPPESHDALAVRLEALQETMDIEFPSQWTRTITAADARSIARLELLASGALQVRLAVRPVKFGPVFAPGEGPVLVLEGQGRDRHGVRRDRPRERESGRALAERLGLAGGEEVEPWCWRVGEGDPALHLVATLQELGDELVVEWADDVGLFALGTVGRRDMRLKVADRRDWFAVDGGAEVKAKGRGRGKARAQPALVPLSELLAAIREERRYVPVGAGGFVRIEESLREALARADGALFESGGALQLATAASEYLLALVEEEAQLEASAAFSAVRRAIAESAAEPLRLDATLDRVLRPYQKAGAAWLARLAHWGAGAVLADEMGLGKTVQALAVLAHRAPSGPALVVAPTSVVPNWVAEAARFTPSLEVRLHRGPGRAASLRGLGPGHLLVTSYAIATLDAEALARIPFGSLVLDEAQAVKNASTERARALRGLNARWRLGLTGTPIENHLGELWSLLRVVSPGLLGSWDQFRGRYAVPIEKYADQQRRQALAALLRPFILRRTKAEVAPELPPRTEVVRSVRLSADELQHYEELRQATIEELAGAGRDQGRDPGTLRFVLLAALTRLRQLCCHPRLVYPRTQASSSKAAYLLELLGELREGGHKALVFSQFRSFLELLAPRLRQHQFRVLVLDGTTPAEVREQRIAAFQAGEADVFLISLKAGGFGLNLTAADYVIHLDPWWNPAVEDQATARAHRIGQDRPVTAVRLVARDTIEEAVLGLHAAKRALAAGILEGSDLAASLETNELIELIRRGPRPAE